ncbi:unnamed protein product [Closterium sp. NIES-53]
MDPVSTLQPFSTSKKSSVFESGQMWDVGAMVLGSVVPGVVLVKCVAAVGAIAFSSWCAVVVVVAAGLQQIHSFDANGYAQQDY